MTFTDTPFFFYLALSLLVFSAVPYTKRWIVLIFSGLVFYAFLDVRFLAALAVMGVSSYVGCWLLARVERRRLQILWLFISIDILWLVLIRLKSVDALAWFGPPLSLYPGSKSEALIGLAVPVGISFHTLQCIAALVDVYRAPAKWDSHPGKMILYISYLPQILAGPTERVHKMFPQFEAPRVVTSAAALQGLEWFIWGLFKKVVIADRFSIVLATFIANPSQFPNAIVAALVVFSFPAYLYMDFSGYTDMARGMSMWFGINLSRNFDAPYSSRTTHEFWQRWHMTLHHFIRDYVYLPLRKTLPNPWLCVMISFAVSGLWHGLSFHFFVWAMASFLLADAEVRMTKRFAWFRTMPLASFRTYLLMGVTCLFFYPPDLGTTVQIVRSLFSFQPVDPSATLTALGWTPVDAAIYFVLSTAYILRDKGSEERAAHRSELARWALLAGLVLTILLLRFSKGAIHPYFRF